MIVPSFAYGTRRRRDARVLVTQLPHHTVENVITHVTSDADLVFICDVLHHVTDRPGWLGRIFAKMGEGARIVLIEFKEGDLPEGPPAKVKLPRAELDSLVRKAGFADIQIDDKLLPYQIVVKAKKPDG